MEDNEADSERESGYLWTDCEKISNFKFQIDPRMIGWMLHANRDPKIPCHRVVDRNGRVADNYSFGGWEEQVRRLKSEGIKFIDEMHVDLKKYQWSKF